MQASFFLSTIKRGLNAAIAAIAALPAALRLIANEPSVVLVSLLILGPNCSSRSRSQEEDILHGTISYPFYQTSPLGTNNPDDKFVIRSAVGNSEYTVEIPGAAKDYDVEVPLASLDSAAKGGPDRPRNLPNPVVTDREMVNDLPSIEKKSPADTAFMDKAFGVGKDRGPGQEPSYTLGLARIMEQYKARQYEYTLIEIDNMLAFYPNSPKLYKMKGTIHAKLRNLPMAEKSWIRALELEPEDRILSEALQRLQRKIRSRIGGHPTGIGGHPTEPK